MSLVFVIFVVTLSGQFPGIASESREGDRGSDRTDLPSNVGSYIVHSNASYGVYYDCHCTYYRMHNFAHHAETTNRQMRRGFVDVWFDLVSEWQNALVFQLCWRLEHDTNWTCSYHRTQLSICRGWGILIEPVHIIEHSYRFVGGGGCWGVDEGVTLSQVSYKSSPDWACSWRQTI